MTFVVLIVVIVALVILIVVIVDEHCNLKQGRQVEGDSNCTNAPHH